MNNGFAQMRRLWRDGDRVQLQLPMPVRRVHTSPRVASNRGRVALALEEMEEVYCEMGAGSVLYFHGNILHASNPNLSDTSRWCLIYAYVPSTNRWILPEAPQLAPIERLDDTAFRAALDAHETRILKKGG